MNNGSLLGFGGNWDYRTGLNSNEPRLLSPQEILPGGVKQVAGADNHSLFLMTDGSLWAAGSNDMGKLGTGNFTSSEPLTKIVNSGVAGMAVGNKHSVYWTTEGEVYVFGSDEKGQLGLGRIRSLHNPRALYDPTK
jgi:alpha-tubulin suppressor-like RCC1 family protein